MQNWIPPACSNHSLHRILSSQWLVHFYLMKKSTKVLLYFILDCEMMEFFTYKSQSKEQLISLPHFWSTVRQKISRFEHMQIVIRRSRKIRDLFAWSGWTLKLFQIFRTEIIKSKTCSGWCPFQGLSNGTTLMQVQSGRTIPLKSHNILQAVIFIQFLF